MAVAELQYHGEILRPAHFAVFRYLEPDGSRIGALAEAAGMTQQSMGELVGHLERAGLLRREVDPADRRARLAVPTEAGRAALRIAADRLAALEHRVIGAVGADGVAELRRLLTAAGTAVREC
ncbi:MarR family winged helix-turn-helix transcriptional regulator [Nocardia asteroides]|uniref:MarR family winged helix-turn-helix transcriptional regulator n=1 Tax=Nocardia asteroides TaxID=1824 RepID=UPI001E5E9E13|nr:MarR family transcriptional regulator [Nocardia asteroides]UGT61680.1 MarR family transcriptional regulator [Nocardia asteroides]